MSRMLPLILLVSLVLAACAGATPAPEATPAPTQPAVPEATSTLPPTAPATLPTETSAASLPQGALRLVLTAEGNQAQFAVREQLASLTLPNDAVGTTTAVEGALVVLPDGQPLPAESRFVVDLTTLKTDSSRRDGYIQSNTLETGTFPEAIFVPTASTGLPVPLPTGGAVAFQLTGDLTVHGITRPVTWDVTGEIAGSALRGTATTSITFTEFGMTLPRVGPVLSVDDLIRLQLDFTFNAE